MEKEQILSWVLHLAAPQEKKSDEQHRAHVAKKCARD
jgi:hypothetical protein